jgi:Protein of unknown function (DUF3108)
VPASRSCLGRAAATGAAAIAFAGLVGSYPAAAQGKLDARYTATLAGIPIGKGVWVIDINHDQFTAAASGGTAGLLKVFAGGNGTSASRGTVNGAGALAPTAYASTTSSERWTEEIRIGLQGGTAKEVSIEPVTPPNPDRIPVTDAHRRGVTDPMTAALIRVPGTGDMVTSEACNRKISVFDGRMRFDVQLAFKRTESVRTEKGYQGPVVVCAAYFQPIAGYVPDRPTIKYLVAQRDMELWLAPVAGTRVMAMYRFSVPTPLGVGVLQATQFVTTGQSANNGKLVPATSARTQ